MTSASTDHITESVQVWYEDGPVDGSDWENLPDDGVQAVVQFFADGTRNVLTAYDYYFRADGPNDYIYGANNDLARAEEYPNSIVLKGRWTDMATYAYIARAVFE